MVVEPNAPVSSSQNLYESEGEDHGKDFDDTPEVTINAATQIRGNGNIISIAQMDSVRIANMIATMFKGEKESDIVTPPQSPEPQISTSTTAGDAKQFPRINITVNCGATIIGDRNIVGPGLGDIARQMQLAQRTQALQAQQQQQQQQQATRQQAQQQSSPSQKMPSPSQRRETLYQAQAAIAQHHGTLYAAQGLLNLHAPTPPMSRSSSIQSDGSGGTKRKAEGCAREGIVKKQC